MNTDDMKGLDEETRKDVEELLKVTRKKDGTKAYAIAQFEIQDYRMANKQYDLSIKTLQKIKESDDKEYYELAKLNIAVIEYNYKNELDGACKKVVELLEKNSWVNRVTRKYAFLFAKDYLSKGKYEKSIQLFKLISIAYSYESNCYGKICKLMLDSKTIKLGEYFLELLDKTLSVVNILKLDFKKLSDIEKSPERKLAHYTGTYTTEKLLHMDEEQTKPSAFRLNTINNVNDPSEGQLLLNYLKGVKETSFYAPDFDEKLHAFVSCFTFNHDSLNQFRLYGKQDNKEASGISLVFNQNFFQEHNPAIGLSYVAFKGDLQKTDTASIKQGAIEVPEDKAFEKSFEGIKEQPVMRCVYIDPTSDYIHLAQRNRLTFFREFGHNILEGGSTTEAEFEWNKYKEYIEIKTDEFKKAFVELKKIYGNAIEERGNLKGMGKEDMEEIDSLLEMIILPLKYLIKHSAFQEEQECRMVYITSLDDPKVKMDFGKFLYVEYEPEVKAHLDKIYIAPAATQYQPYLAKLLCDTNVKIEPSNNPYRQN
ncbi:hypothetical protein IQ457_00040 [Psychrobacter sp. M9-54-1]|uniref:hypothetical protein n=1 Tax=Psychrobacter sp. M9-54-1 TaxID=2782386 RepID=UPI00190AF391|nr:hypothetical protein [Psychrobacter sp. M9-54-1]MBK3392344.1 hypothetical protein [Psychrobacter sp. M9-54-1]